MADELVERKRAPVDLGEFIFAKSPVERRQIILSLTLGPPLFLLSLFLAVRVGGKWICLFLISFAGIVWTVYHLVLRKRWLFYQYGMIQRTAWSQWVLSYDAVEELTYAHTKVFMNEKYSHSTIVMNIRPAGQDRPLRIDHMYKQSVGLTTGIHCPNELDEICDLIASKIAARMEKELNLGRPVCWTAGMVLHRTSLEINTGDARWLHLEWKQIARADLDQAVFSLWQKGVSSPVVQIAANQPNFYPGYRILVAQLRKEPSVAPDPSPDAALPMHKLNSPLHGAISVEYAVNADDLRVLYRYEQQMPENRKKRWIETGRCFIIFAFFLLIFLPLLIAKALPFDLGTLTLVVIFLISLFFALSNAYVRRRRDYKQISTELQDARKLAMEGKCADPSHPQRITLHANGVLWESAQEQKKCAWAEFSRIEWFEGYTLVFRAADRTSREKNELLIPPRAFRDRQEAERFFETICRWHANATESSRTSLSS
jgi:hypothetical protein